MDSQDSHPILQQTALAVNPFIDLPKPPTLPPNYTSLPPTLPPSILSTPPAGANSEHPAYVTTTSGGFAAHPSTIIAQNRSLLEQIKREGESGKKQVDEWEAGIRERELQERRRKAPGWLDREEKILEPTRKVEGVEADTKENLMDDDALQLADESRSQSIAHHQRELDDLGAAMDRAFGRSEMGG